MSVDDRTALSPTRAKSGQSLGFAGGYRPKTQPAMTLEYEPTMVGTTRTSTVVTSKESDSAPANLPHLSKLLADLPPYALHLGQNNCRYVSWETWN